MSADKERERLAESLVKQARANGGLAPMDLPRFWADQEQAVRDPWAADCPQVPFGIGLCRRYNDKAQAIVGRRLLSEEKPDPARRWPPVKELADLFEASNIWHNESYWLQQSAHDEKELGALLDRVERRLEKLPEFILPPDWAGAKTRILAAGGSVPLYRGQRGPVTFAMSVYGVENMIFLLADNQALAARFRDLILRAMLARARVLDEEAGFTPATAPRGFYFCDDNCAMLNRDMYEFFGCPILKGVFARYSPDRGDLRGQHSDSDMGHLLPLLGRLGLTSCNFGPRLTVAEIRAHLPKAVIYGQLAPFTFSRNEEVKIVAEFLRDYEMAREKRGLVFATAGSVNDGSRLTGMRLIMAAIQQHGRYGM